MKFGLAPTTSVIFKKESLWIGIESIPTTGNEASPGIESPFDFLRIESSGLTGMD